MASPISLNTQAAVGTDSPQPSGLLTSQQDLSPTANSNFALFPKLPIELRLIVWEMALPEPRWIEVRFAEGRILIDDSRDPKTLTHWILHPQNERSPATLFTSQESRQVALKHYQPFIHGKPPQDNRTAYIDPVRDTLFCKDPCWDSKITQHIAEVIPKLARLALVVLSVMNSGSLHSDIKLLSELKELFVVPTWAHSLGHAEFEDIGKEQWNSEIACSNWPQYAYSQIQQSSGIPRAPETEADDSDAWVAPRLRIGRFVGDLGHLAESPWEDY